jgi:hypothetical protein
MKESDAQSITYYVCQEANRAGLLRDGAVERWIRARKEILKVDMEMARRRYSMYRYTMGEK